MFLLEMPEAQCVEISIQVILALGAALSILKMMIFSPHSSGLV